MNKLLVIDGNSMLHRAYYALPDWRNRSGEATAGVYGFLSMMLKAAEELKPTHLAIVFDLPGQNFRHALYVGYQATREKDPQVSEDIWGQAEKLKIVFEKMQIPVYTAKGFEADDVIGTICEICESNSEVEEVVAITGDRDLMQLVSDKVRLYMPTKGLSDGQLVDDEKVVARMGVHANQIIDYKALVGDGSDNYPGVAGVGPKTAAHLLAEYGKLKKIYQEIDKLDGKIKDKLVKGREGAKVSETLATIRRDVPIKFLLEEATIPSEEKIFAVLKELGYKSLLKRMGAEDIRMDDTQQKLFE